MFGATLPFRRQLAWGVALVALVWLAAGSLAYLALRQLHDATSEVTERVNPATAAAYEMEIQVVEVGLKVLKFLQRAEPQYRAGALKDMQQFDEHQRHYDRLAASDAQRTMSGNAKALFSQYRTLGVALMDGASLQTDSMLRLRSGLRALDTSIAKATAPSIDPRAPGAETKQRLWSTMELELAEIGDAVASHAQQPAPEHAAQIELHTLEFEQALSALQRAPLDAPESAALREVAASWALQRTLHAESVEQRQNMDRQLTRFVALRVQLDDLLDEGIQAEAATAVGTAQRQVQEAQQVGVTTLLLGLALTALVSALIYKRLSRRAKAALGRFNQAADAFGSGQLEHRLPRFGDAELDRMADAYHRMAQRLQETMVSAQRLRASEGKLRDILMQMDEGYYEADLRGSLKLFNPALARILGYPDVELPGLDLLRRVSAPAAEQLIAAVTEVFETGKSRHGLEFAFQTKAGTLRTLTISVQRVHDAAGQPSGFRGLIYDVTEKRRLEGSIEHLVVRDALTGLPNRMLLQDRVAQTVAQAARESDSCALLLIRVNGLSEVNNAVGHQDGDMLLSLLAMRLQKEWGDAGTLARSATDEFALLISGPDLQQGREVAREILRLFDAPFDLDCAQLHVTASIGLALFPQHTDNADGLLRCAGLALAGAHLYHDGLSVYRAADGRAEIEKFVLGSELRQALDGGVQFRLDYQPKRRLLDDRPCGMEALARWTHPQHGAIGPSEFIPHLERRGLIGRFTLWALETAAQQQLDWRASGLYVSIAVNVSPIALLDVNFVKRVLDIVDRVGKSADWLELELTESTLMEEPERMLERLAPLMQRGVRLAIDDFGTGYSSLAMLRRFKAHALKIDGSFIRAMTHDADNTVIVQTIIQLAHNLGMTVVAEGVESGEISDRLAALGCDEVQGFAVSAPMPATEATKWLRDTAPSAFAAMGFWLGAGEPLSAGKGSLDPAHADARQALRSLDANARQLPQASRLRTPQASVEPRKRIDGPSREPKLRD